MNYQEFHAKFHNMGCFSTHQVYSWKPDFDKNNLGYWVAKNRLIKLRNGWYAFAEYKAKPNFALYVANRIYRPSYISLHTALAFYGLIPESVVQVTSVTTLKTAEFTNDLAGYSYKSVQPDYFFGYDSLALFEGHSLLLALPEKALLDLFYLYPFYNTEQEMLDLRLDEDFLHNQLNRQLLREFTDRFVSPVMTKRTNLMLTAYNL